MPTEKHHLFTLFTSKCQMLANRIHTLREQRHLNRTSAEDPLSNSTSNYRKIDHQWTRMLILCNFAIVIGTSFMAGFNFRVTGSEELENVLMPPQAISSSHQSREKLANNNRRSIGMDVVDILELDATDGFPPEKIQNIKHHKLFAHLCIFTLFIAKLLGMFWFSAACGDKFGRTKTLIICSILGFFASTINLATHWTLGVCESVTPFNCVIPTIFSQAILGFQTGVGLVVTPALLVELAPRNLRGACGALHELFFVLGSILSLFADTFILEKDKATQFNLIFSCAVYILQCVMLLFVCESPRWLFYKGREDDALESLKVLRGVDGFLLEDELDEYGTREKAMTRGRFSVLILVGAALSLGYMMTGRDIIDMFGPLGLRHDFEPRVLALSYITISLIAILSHIILVDRIRRRLLVFTGLLFMIGSLIAFAVLASLDKEFVIVAGVCSMFFITAFSIGPGPISNFMTAEMFGQQSRLTALSYSQSIGFLFYLVWRVVAAFGNIKIFNEYPYLLAILFGAISLIVLGFLYFFLPETSDGSLESVSVQIALKKYHTVPRKPEFVDRLFRKVSFPRLRFRKSVRATVPVPPPEIVIQQEQASSSSSNHKNKNKKSPVDVFDNFQPHLRRNSAPVVQLFRNNNNQDRALNINQNPAPFIITARSHPIVNEDGVEVVFDSNSDFI